MELCRDVLAFLTIAGIKGFREIADIAYRDVQIADFSDFLPDTRSVLFESGQLVKIENIKGCGQAP